MNPAWIPRKADLRHFPPQDFCVFHPRIFLYPANICFALHAHVGMGM